MPACRTAIIALLFSTAALKVAAQTPLPADTRRAQAPASTSHVDAPATDAATSQAGTAPAEGGAGAKLGEIIVTAQRREQRLQSVPSAVTALTASALKAADITRATDLTQVTPSFNFSEFVGRSDQVSFGIRGQRTTDSRLTDDGAVIPYIAEVPVARPYGIGVTGFLDDRSVEILKGPVGTLFGRNTTGGAVLITPNTPTNVTEGSIDLKGGNYRTGEFQGVFNQPINDDMGFRVAAIVGHHDGYIENRGPFHDLDSENYAGGRGSFKYHHGPLTSIFYADYLDYNGSGTAGVVVASNPAGPGNLLPLGTGGALTNAVAEQQASNFYSARSNEKTFARTQVGGVSNTTTYDLPDHILLKNIVGYRQFTTDAPVDADGTAYTILHTDLAAHGDQFTEELQGQYNGQRLHLIGGLFYFEESGVNGGNTDVLQGLAFKSLFDEGVQNISRSVFAEGTYDITPKLKLTLGGRYTSDIRKYNPTILTDYTKNLVGAAPLGIVCAETDAAGNPLPNCRANDRATFSKPTYNVTGQYQLTRSNQVYASIRSGYRTGGFSTGSETAEERVPYQPETITSYEVGSKNDFDLGGTMALRLNVAGYYSDYSNIQKSVNYIDPNGVLVTVIQNAASAVIKGVEVESTLVFNRDFEVSGFYSYTDAHYGTYISHDGTGAISDLSGEPFGFLPENKVGLSSRYTIDLPSNRSLSLIGNISYQSREWLDDNPSPGIQQRGYELTNLRADLKLSDQLTVSAYGKNVFDTKYYSSGNNIYDSIGATILYQGQPATYGFELAAKF